MKKKHVLSNRVPPLNKMLEDIAKGGSLMVSPSYSNQHQSDIYFTLALQVPYNLSLTIASDCPVSCWHTIGGHPLEG